MPDSATLPMAGQIYPREDPHLRFVVPLWIAAGTADAASHLETDIETISGPKESAFCDPQDLRIALKKRPLPFAYGATVATPIRQFNQRAGDVTVTTHQEEAS